MVMDGVGGLESSTDSFIRFGKSFTVEMTNASHLAKQANLFNLAGRTKNQLD